MKIRPSVERFWMALLPITVFLTVTIAPGPRAQTQQTNSGASANSSSCRNVENVQCVDSKLARGGTDAFDEANKAYAACPSAGCHIVFAPGSFNVSTPAVFATPGKPVFLDCAPGVDNNQTANGAITQFNWTLTNNGKPTGTAITIDAGTGSNIRGCSLQGPGPGPTNNSVGLQWSLKNGCIYCTTEKMDIGGFGIGEKFGSNLYVGKQTDMTLHDNGQASGQNILFPPGLTEFGENLTFEGGSCSAKGGYSAASINILSGGDFHFNHMSMDGCGITLSGTNIFLDLEELHMEAPGGKAAMPYITIGPAANVINLNLKDGRIYEGYPSGRTAFILDTSRVANKEIQVSVHGTNVTPAEQGVYLYQNSGSGCCPVIYATALQNGIEGPQLAGLVAGPVYNSSWMHGNYWEDVEQAAPKGAPHRDYIWADGASHAWKESANGSGNHFFFTGEIGSCTMSGNTTCTFSTTAFSQAPKCLAYLDANSTPPATAIAATCSISGTTVTIKAGAGNSLTWDALLVGN
jgi:hypothetical protein